MLLLKRLLHFYKNNFCFNSKDVPWLAGKLPNMKELIRFNLDLYNHYDFAWATENNPLLYDPIIDPLPSTL